MRPLALKRFDRCETRGMCRSIITLRRPEPEVSWEECEAAAQAFARAIVELARAPRVL